MKVIELKNTIQKQKIFFLKKLAGSTQEENVGNRLKLVNLKREKYNLPTRTTEKTHRGLSGRASGPAARNKTPRTGVPGAPERRQRGGRKNP